MLNALKRLDGLICPTKCLASLPFCRALPDSSQDTSKTLKALNLNLMSTNQEPRFGQHHSILQLGRSQSLSTTLSYEVHNVLGRRYVVSC